MQINSPRRVQIQFVLDNFSFQLETDPDFCCNLQLDAKGYCVVGFWAAYRIRSQGFVVEMLIA